MATCELGDYLQNELFDTWSRDRQEIETKWLKNDNAFRGIAEGVWKAEEGEDWRSNTFIMATKIKILSAYSVVIDILLQGGMVPFALAPSPWDSILMEDMPEDQRETVQDQIDDMTGLIHQQIQDCDGDRALMNCVMAAAKFGETYWKTYIHDVIRRGFNPVSFAPERMPSGGGPDQFKRFEYFEKIIKSMAFEYVPVWDMFRDIETDDMQTSRGYCHRSYVSPWELKSLVGKNVAKDKNRFKKEEIERAIKNNNKALATSTGKQGMTPGLRNIRNRYNTIEQKEFWCRVPRVIIDDFDKQGGGDNHQDVVREPENDGDEVEVGAWMADDEVIRLVRVKEKTRPHGRVVWEINLDDNFGIGVADNLESVQQTLNGMVRAFEDNKKLSANIMLAIKESLLVDWSGKFTPGELVKIAEEAKSASEAMQQIIVQDVGDSLLSGIGLMERYADEVSMLPKIMQGAIHDKQKPDTLGEINILQANAGKYLGSVIKNFDEGMIEPIVWRFYEYNMLDPSITKGKGNYIAKPLGFTSFQNKIVRLQKILQAVQIASSVQPLAVETRFKALGEEVYKSLDIDPQVVFKSKEEKEAEGQQMAQAQQAQSDMAAMMLLAKAKSEGEKEIAKINAAHAAKLEQIEAEHRARLDEIEAESQNRIAEHKIMGNNEDNNKKELKGKEKGD